MSQPWPLRMGHTCWRLVTATVGSCLRYRVTGLAAEAAFFAVLSVPPLIFALAGTIGFITTQFTPAEVEQVRMAVLDLSSRFLTERAVTGVIRPTINDVLAGGRFDVISLGFVLALWSGSRALNVFIDTITIMHGLGGARGIVKTRALSFSLYVMALITGVVGIPLVVAGPQLVNAVLPARADFLLGFYWPLVAMICICFLATLYHVSVPVRTAWSFNLPGAVFSLVGWIGGSALLRWVLTVTATDSRSIYGPLAAPIAVLLWLYLVAIVVLIGAAVNAAFDSVLTDGAARRRSREKAARVARRKRDKVRRKAVKERPTPVATRVGAPAPPREPPAKPEPKPPQPPAKPQRPPAKPQRPPEEPRQEPPRPPPEEQPGKGAEEPEDGDA